MGKMSGKQHCTSEATGRTEQKGLAGADDACHCPGTDASKRCHAYEGYGEETHDPPSLVLFEYRLKYGIAGRNQRHGSETGHDEGCQGEGDIARHGKGRHPDSKRHGGYNNYPP